MLDVTLDAPLPPRVEVGEGTAILLSGRLAPGALRAGEVQVADQRWPVRISGPRRADENAMRWWVVIPVQGLSARRVVPVSFSARTDLGELTAQLGAIELVREARHDHLRVERARAGLAAIAGDRAETRAPIVAIYIRVSRQTRAPDLRRQLQAFVAQEDRRWIAVLDDRDADEETRAEASGFVDSGAPLFLLSRSALASSTALARPHLLPALQPPFIPNVAFAEAGDIWNASYLRSLLGHLRGGAMVAFSGFRSAGTTKSFERGIRRHPSLKTIMSSVQVSEATPVCHIDLWDLAHPSPPSALPGREGLWLLAVGAAIGTVHYEGDALYERHPRSETEAAGVGGVGLHLSHHTAEFRARVALAASVSTRCDDLLDAKSRSMIERVYRSGERRIRRAGSLTQITPPRSLILDRLRRGSGADLVKPLRADTRAGNLAMFAGPRAIHVDGLTKTFRLPVDRATTLKARVLHPRRHARHRPLPVLRGVSFSVGRGEFFGIVGRNGSGKSTLLKILAGIYRADAGRIQIQRSVAPIIELGVGFQNELSALDNVILNGEMMGLTSRQARERFDAILAFADLDEFVDLKLKNYSSGMRVRLAFAIALQSDADVYLLDEVLAVGDAGFQQKCNQAFGELKVDPTKTVVLVSHQMTQVERYCDRALLLDQGRIAAVGDPSTVSSKYDQLSLAQTRLSTIPRARALPSEGHSPTPFGVAADGSGG